MIRMVSATYFVYREDCVLIFEDSENYSTPWYLGKRYIYIRRELVQLVLSPSAQDDNSYLPSEGNS